MTNREMLEHVLEVLEAERDDRDAGLTTLLLDLLEDIIAHLKGPDWSKPLRWENEGSLPSIPQP